MTRALAIVCLLLAIALGIAIYVANDRQGQINLLAQDNRAKAQALANAADTSQVNSATIVTLQVKLAEAAGHAQDLQRRLDTANHDLADADTARVKAQREAEKARGLIYAHDPASAEYGRALMPGPLSERLRQRYEALRDRPPGGD
jgi:uncharacterized protein HemX